MKAMERELLLEGVDELLIAKDENITLSLVIGVVGIVLFILFLFVPKIYFSNNIYNNSVQIRQLKKEYLSLMDENKILKNKIAILKYKIGVTH